MNHFKLARNTLLAVLAVFVIFFASGEEQKASAASVDSLNSVASKYIGVKYSYGGTTAKGFDCSGYVRHVFKELGVNSLPRSSKAMYGVGTSVKKSDLQAGDLVFFNTFGSGVSHVGIYIGNGQFIHASTSKGVIKTSINDKYYWGKRYIGAKRVTNFTTTVAAVEKATETVEEAVEEVQTEDAQ